MKNLRGMKHLTLAGAVFTTMLTGGLAPVAQARDARPPAAIQQEYDAFITKFRAALQANDADAVTQMTRFPFYQDEMRDAAYFRKTLYAKVFPAKVRTCLAKAKGVYDRSPSGEENFTHFCGNVLYLFTRTPDGFRFAETGPND